MNRWLIVLICLGTLALAACAEAQSPRLIAALPAGGEGEHYPISPDQFVYDAYLEIEVYDPNAAAAKASELAEAYGGYLVSLETARRERETQVTVVLAVPASYFEKLRSGLLRLGTLQRERLYGDWQDGGWNVYSEVTVDFRSSALSLPDFSGGWDPGRTFRRAFEVFVTVFGFLVDILIWVLVVAGPFALLIWLGFRLFRRLRRGARSG